MINAQGEQGMQNLPACRGRHPHLGTFTECDELSRLLILGASNQWFGKTLNVLSVPPSQASEVTATVARLWDQLSAVTSREVLASMYGSQYTDELAKWPIEEIWDAIQEGGPSRQLARDQRRRTYSRPEWDMLTQTPAGPPLEDFALRPTLVPDSATGLIAEVRQVERLRLVRALVGFSRFDAPDPEQPDLIEVARLSRAETPEWVPATEVRGEGVFVRLAEDRLAAWERIVKSTRVAEEHRRAYAQFRKNRYSERYPRPQGYDWAFGWPSSATTCCTPSPTSCFAPLRWSVATPRPACPSVSMPPAMGTVRCRSGHPPGLAGTRAQFPRWKASPAAPASRPASRCRCTCLLGPPWWRVTPTACAGTAQRLAGGPASGRLRTSGRHAPHSPSGVPRSRCRRWAGGRGAVCSAWTPPAVRPAFR
jgi:hypothetical protein